MLTRREFQEELMEVKDLAFSFSLKLTRDYQNAQDLFQNACYRAFRYRKTYKPGSNFKAWLCTIIRNDYYTEFQKKKRLNMSSDPMENHTHSFDKSHFVRNDGEDNFRVNYILQLFDKLDDKYRITFLMHYRGYEYKEIANFLDLPIGTIKSRIFTARKYLKEALA